MRLWFAAFLLSMISVSAWAQKDQPLRGFKSFDLVIEALDEDARICGLTESAIDTSARFVLGQSRAKIASSAPAYLYINANLMALSSRESCIYSIQLGFKAGTRVLENNEFAIATLWSTGGIGIAPRGNTSRNISNMVEQYLKQFVVEWNKSN